ncbi:RagB/SusD family nutrient uptake outer membrane protein [Flavobacterium sp. SM2513]|uniref:RagB/SusD family nutrient uptake outer membrane protein n=1 Tax=Flavobacterium sp. SM2513 TaxID=3424766 RepID=UPI003D7F302E
MKTDNHFNATTKRYLQLLFFFVLGIFHSCDDYVEVDPPNAQLTGTTVFADMTTATAAIASLYAKMRTNGILAGNSTGLSVYLGLYADEFDYFQLATTSNFYNNTLVPTDSGISTLWNHSYRQIYDANAIITGVANSNTLPQAGKEQLTGEALFVRALLHCYLVNTYGAVPYIKTTDHVQNSKVKRLPVDQVYEAIATDLEEAIHLLPETYVTSERVRPNKFAAYAVLARVHLYREKYAEASNAASAVLNSELYVWQTNLDAEFLKTSTATIWQFMPNNSTSNTNEGSLYIFTAGPPSVVGLKPEFVNAFNPTDLRKEKWIKKVTNGANTWYHAYKYKQQSLTPTSQEYSIVLRMAEQYLIRAEARAKEGNLTSAIEDLNVIRVRAGLTPTTATTGQAIIADIREQRRFELFTEFGNRFFDLKRSGTLDAILPQYKPGWNSTDQLWPLPALELIANPNLNPQNPGY